MTDRIENTRNRDNLVHLLGMMSEGQSGYIESMEADGQRQLVNSTLLPKDGPWGALAQLGFIRGEDSDDLFCTATLPDGWRKEGSDHAMWSYILDTRGVRMVGVFYKAAFYDRSAHMGMQNPGYSAATHEIYGDEPVAIPERWDVFTEGEKRAFWASVTEYERNAREHPSIYADRLPRVRRIRELVQA